MFKFERLIMSIKINGRNELFGSFSKNYSKASVCRSRVRRQSRRFRFVKFSGSIIKDSQGVKGECGDAAPTRGGIMPIRGAVVPFRSRTSPIRVGETLMILVGGRY
jgi:hypothetical protein